MLRRWPCIRPYLCAQIPRGSIAAWTTRALRMAKSACAQCTVCCVPHAGLRCCFAECIAMCAWSACMHTVSQPSADACLLVPIIADHVGGLHVAMLFEWCVQAFPSGHVGPPATSGNKRRVGKGLHTRGGGGMGGAVPKRWRSVWCMLCAMHVSTGYAPGPRISVAFIARSSLAAITG